MSTTAAFTLIFISALAFCTLLRLWLGMRQIRHVNAHREQVPPHFAGRISLDDHHKAADYTTAKTRLGLLEIMVGTLLVLALTLGGLLNDLTQLAGSWFPDSAYAQGVALFALYGLMGLVTNLPFAWYRTFGVEARFGFNKMTPALFISDTIKHLLLAILVGGPLILAVLWLMEFMGDRWWIWVWLFWLGFNLLMLALYPTMIAPLFNRFSPLTDETLKARIEALLARCGFCSNGLFVMDGSKRSAHGNAYFTGFGAAKRIVFFDTLLQHLQAQEVEAVLAHELGHFKHHHLWKRLGSMAVLGLGVLWLLGQVMGQEWFFAGLGIHQQGTAIALLLFSLVLPIFVFPLSPVFSAFSRRHEYEADAYAAAHTNGNDLATALVKLYRDNAATLTPDPMHSLFYDSHPPASLRIARLGSN